MDRLARFASAENYALFYGSGREGDLAGFDVAVVEPAGQSDDSLRRMRESGTLVLAYISVVEVSPGEPEYKLLKPGDLLSRGGEPIQNPVYGNYLADLRSTRWIGLLLRKAGSLLTGSGYDGLFLDTIGDVESGDLGTGLRDSLLLAAADLVRRIRTIHSGRVLVQNNGLERLCLLTAGLIDGICWENLRFGEPLGPWNEAVAGRLEKLKESRGIKILLLLEEGGGAGHAASAEQENNFRLARDFAYKKGFLLYRAPAGYTGGVNQPGPEGKF